MRPIYLPDGILRPVIDKVVGSALPPAIEDTFVTPMVILPAHHELLFDPDQALPQRYTVLPPPLQYLMRIQDRQPEIRLGVACRAADIEGRPGPARPGQDRIPHQLARTIIAQRV